MKSNSSAHSENAKTSSNENGDSRFPDYTKLIEHYLSNPAPYQTSLKDGEKFLRSMFRPNDYYIVKPDRRSKSTDCHLLSGHEALPAQLATFNPIVFLLNPISEKTVKAIKNDQNVSFGVDSIGKFQNFRFEYDDDGFGRKLDKITQLQFFQQSDLPTTALLDTGNKSLHLLISIDGVTSVEEYRLIATSILARLPGFPDHAAIEPSQPIWLPGGRRSKEDDPSHLIFPKLLYCGQPILKEEIYAWILRTPINRPELLTHLKTPPGTVSEAHDELLAQDDDIIAKAVEDRGGKIVGRHPLGWIANCPLHDNRRSPTALIYRSGWVSCVSSHCIGGAWLLPRKERDQADGGFSYSEIKEAFEFGLTAEDLANDRENERYFGQSISLSEILKRNRKIVNQLGHEKSTCFVTYYENIQSCCAAMVRLRSFGQACFYGKGDQGEYFIYCVFEKPINALEFDYFVAGCAAFNFLAKKPHTASVSELEQIKKAQVCSFQQGQWGTLPDVHELDHLLKLRPSFWLNYFLPPTEVLGGGKRRFRRLVQLFPPNAKILTPELIERVGNTVDSAMATAEPHKLNTLPKLLPIKDGVDAGYTVLAKAGVSIGHLVKNGFQIGKSTSENFGSLPDFWELLRLEEGRKKALISDSSATLTGGPKQGLLSIIRSEKIGVASPYFCAVAPAGYGKTEFLQEYLPEEFRHLGYRSAIVARERVLDALDGEGKANDDSLRRTAAEPFTGTIEEHRQQLLKQEPGRVFKIGKAKYESSESRVVVDNESDGDDGGEIELSDEQWAATQEAMDTNIELSRRAVVYSAVTYKEEFCLKPDKGPPHKIPANFCSSACVFKTCRAHPDHRKRLPFQEFIITTHEAASQGGKHLTAFTDADGGETARSAIIFDEKPSGVFEEFSVGVSDSKIDIVDDIIAVLEQKSDDANRDLIEHIKGLRRFLLDKLSDFRYAITKMKGPQKADQYLRLGHKNILGILGDQRVVYALMGLTQKQKTQKNYFDVKRLMDHCKGLIYYDGPFIESYKRETDSMTISWGKPMWAELRKAWPNTFIVMDATAHLDPDYSLPGAPKLVRLPKNLEFPNLTIHSTSLKDVSNFKLTNNLDEYEKELRKLLESIDARFPGEEILVVTKLGETESRFKAVLSQWKQVHVDHFGNLKGSNQYRHCKHIIFTHFLRWNLDSYLLRALWLSEKGTSDILTKKATPSMWGNRGIMISRGEFSNAAEFRNQELEMLRLQYETPDTIQTIMRTALRENSQNSVHVWLPGQNPRKIGMLLDYFVGAKVQTFAEFDPE